MSNAPSTQNNAQPIHSFWRISVVYFGSNGQTISKSMMTKETLSPLPQETTPTLTKYLLTSDLNTIPQEVLNDFWWYLDQALGYEFWIEQQEKIQCLKESTPHHQNGQR